ncbi:hypothetical protein Pan258_01970 [Symmachiella dynata]|uniref:hypothetical protein n=1 Tax=Symmachiella dynata TaxID=2527995 RepID=UPI0011897DE2|nr:hypothetical protein [Symmachiella dynata]QDT46180.1 hypothetical protein Pan258_01970 [Symmachiella dynata]
MPTRGSPPAILRYPKTLAGGLISLVIGGAFAVQNAVGEDLFRITEGGSITAEAPIESQNLSGAKITSMGTDFPIVSQKAVSVILHGSGSQIGVGQAKVSFPAYFSGALVAVHALHGEAGGGLTTYDVNINGVSALSTKLTVDGSETDSNDAAAPAVIDTSANRFAQWAGISIDVDSVAGAPASGSTLTLIFEPDTDGFQQFNP